MPDYLPSTAGQDQPPPPPDMGQLASQVGTARDAGYSDAEITDYLSKSPQWGRHFQTALAAKYAPKDILDYVVSQKPGLMGTAASDLADIGRGVARGAITGTGQAIAGGAEKAQAGMRENSARMLGLFDGIDKGQPPPGGLDPYTQSAIQQYITSPPQIRQQMRGMYNTAATEAVQPGAVQRAGEATMNYGESIAPPTTWGGKAAQFAGGLAPVVGGAVVGGPVGAGIVIAAQAYDSAYRDAASRGVPHDKADQAASITALTQGALMGTPVGRALDMVPAPLKDGFIKTVINMGKQGVEFGSFNALATFADNFVAHFTTDPKRPFSQGVWDAAEEGAVAGMVIPATGALVRGAARMVRPGEQPAAPGAPPPTQPAQPAPVAPTGQPITPEAAALEEDAHPATAEQAAVKALSQQPNTMPPPEGQVPFQAQPPVPPAPVAPPAAAVPPVPAPRSAAEVLDPNSDFNRNQPKPTRPSTPEPSADIKAQLDALKDPKNPKDAVFIPAGQPVPRAPKGAVSVKRAEGTLITNNPEKANGFKKVPTLSDRVMGILLGYPETKDEAIASGHPVVVQGTDEQGNVVHESVASPEGVAAAAEAAGQEAPNVKVTTPQAAQERREENGWTEIGKNENDQTLYEDRNGVRSYIENGVRHTESVQMRPTRQGMQPIVAAPADKESRFQVEEEAESPGPHPPETGSYLVPPPGNSRGLVPDSASWWDAQSPEQKAELVKRAGVDPRAAEWTWGKMSRDTRAALRTEKMGDYEQTTEPQPPGVIKEWNYIGQNHRGLPLFENPAGTQRAYVDNGIPYADNVPPGRLAPHDLRVPEERERYNEMGVTQNPPDDISDWVRRKLERKISAGAKMPGALAYSPNELNRYAELVVGKKLSEGLTRDMLYDAQELGVNRYIQRHADEFNPAVDYAPDAARMARELEKLKNTLLTQTVRAGEKDTHQQFSTPPDYAFAAAWVANIGPKDHVIEPSAGTGSLAVMAQNAKAREVTANEISEKRRNMLSLLKPTRVTQEDASQLHNVLPAEIKPTVALMNPPFSAAPGRMGNRMVLQEGANHVEQALKRLEPGGRLVSIVGRGMTMEAPAFKDWWKKIGANYDVRANIGVGGKVYSKYGTSFGTRLLVIDKAPPSGRPIITGDAENAAGIVERLKGVRDERPSPGEPAVNQPTGTPLAETGQGARQPEHELPGPTGMVGPGERGVPGEGTERPGAPGAAQPGAVNRKPTGQRRPRGGAGNEVLPGERGGEPGANALEPGAGPAAGREPEPSGGGGDTGGVRPDGSGQLADPGVTETPPPIAKTEQAVSDPKNTELTDAVFEAYKPERVKIQGAKPHPGPLVQSAAMASVRPPEPKYNLRLPPNVIKDGLMSDAQLEAAVYAGAAHAEMLPSGVRRGFMDGDGTGVGKGRIAAGVILDNFGQGRKKAVWISESKSLINDAKDAWGGIGQNRDDIMDHGKIKAGDPINAKQGILFSTYATMRSAEQKKNEGAEEGKPTKVKGQSRVDQIVKWFGKDFDGVVVFDEAHNMQNAIAMKGARGVKEASAKALAGLELQRKLPNARVLYMSATGATEVTNLAYAERLGLWGEGTPFANSTDFMNKVQSGGVAAMELVARDMKALGHYIARNLSYDGVEYDRVQHALTDSQRADYDKLAEAWQVVLQNFNKWAEETKAAGKGGNSSAIMSQFWGGHQRFFNQVITSMQTPTVLKAVEKDLAEGRQVILQLVNTMEAAQGRALEKLEASGESLEDLDITPKDQLMQMVEKSFPIQQHEEYMDEEGNIRVRAAVDSKGNPVINKEAERARDELLMQLGSIKVPDGPLDMVLNHFGTDNVAEVTGRKERVVYSTDDRGQRVRVKEKRGGAANTAEGNAFQDGKKKILIFSDAGGTGRSFHAAIGSGSANARRSHYLLQPGWRADKAVQGLGRGHRTNQASAPLLHLVQTDLNGQKRFISSIARRLGQLGALTKGERRAADQGLFSMKDNLESDQAQAAKTQFFKDVYRGTIEGVSMDDLEKSMGLHLRDEHGQLRQDLPPIQQFLNRILSLKIDDQNRVFDAYAKGLDDIIEREAAAGNLDTGVETYKADKINKTSEQTVYTDKRSGAETKHVQLAVQHKNNPVPYDRIASGNSGMSGFKKPEQWVRNLRSGRVFGLNKTISRTTKEGEVVDQVRLASPLSYQFVDKHLIGERFETVDEPTAQQNWNDQVAKTPEFHKSDLHLITGAVLPVWDRLSGKPTVYRLQTDAGERMLGRVIPNENVNDVLTRLGAGQQAQIAQEPHELIERLMGGASARLANDWVIQPRRVANEVRLELKGPSWSHNAELERQGVFRERIGYDTRYFIPTGEKGAEVLQKITENRPVVSMYGGEGETQRQLGSKLYSFPGALFDPEAWKGALSPLRQALNKPEPSYELLRDKASLGTKAIAEIKAGFAPTSLKGAAPMEHAIRRYNAETAQAFDRSFEAMEKVRAAIDALPKEAQVEFTHRMETGQAQPTPALQAVADGLRQQLDLWKNKVQSLGRGFLSNAIENYMGHIWGNYHEWASGRDEADPQSEMERRARGQTDARSPLWGSRNFQKQRTFPTQLEGINAGLKPVTYNPVDLQLIKIREMQRFYHAYKLHDRLKDEGIARWVPATKESDAKAAGMVQLQDRIFQPRLMGEANPAGFGRLEPGNYWAMEPAARLFNNFMSQGWHGQSSIYGAFRSTNNALNALQLGFSGFHASFVAIDSVISKSALGMQQISEGKFLRGMGNLAQGSIPAAPFTIASTYRKGAALRSAWLDPESATPEMRAIVNALKLGGGRVSMPQFYKTQASGTFFKHLKDVLYPEAALGQAAQMFRDAEGITGKALLAPIKIAGRMIDTTMEPLMGHLVPRMKLGVFSDMATNWLRDHPQASAAEVAEAMTKFVDSVDNRLGQLNYDNLFWNKALKDTAFIMSRSVGWNLGTLRELGGAFVDSASAIKAVAAGKAPSFTARMAYTIALPIVTAQVGAIMTYMATGRQPHGWDYFAPPTGNQDQQGTQERLNIPGYMKDVIGAYHAPLQTVLNKLAPLSEAIQEVVQNKDYYGGIIYDPERDRGPAQAYGDFLLNEAAPFSLRAMKREQAEGSSSLGQSLAWFGFQPAPKWITAPGRGERFQQRQERMQYRTRQREPGRIQFFNTPASP